MARTTIEDVKSIMTEEVTLDDPTVQKYINTANIWITSVFIDDTTTEDDMLTELEKYFAAHLIKSTQYPQIEKEEIGDAAIQYAAKFGEGLASTPYGQMMLDLDISGLIKDATKRKASMYAIKSFD